MNKEEKLNNIEMPFLGLLMNVGIDNFKQPYYFNTQGFFWSLTRLFECYHRVAVSCLTANEGRKGNHNVFLASDLEHFIVRHNILMNDVALLIRKFYPENERGMPSPKGGVHPLNREQSFEELQKFFTIKRKELHPELKEVLSRFVNKASKDLRKNRNDILHYQAKVVIFGDDNFTFAFMDPADTSPKTTTPQGGLKIVTIPVLDFVNETIKDTLFFINVELVNVYTRFVNDKKWKLEGKLGDPRISCIGIEIYRKINKI